MPAVGGPAGVHRPAGVALPVHPRLGGAEQPLHLAELGVGLLQLGGFAREHVEAVVVAHGHLVGEPAEIPGERGDALSQLVAAAAQLGQRAGGETADGPRRLTGAPSPARSGTVPVRVDIGPFRWAPSC